MQISSLEKLSFNILHLPIFRINCNVDVIVSGVSMMNKINTTVGESVGDHESLENFDQLSETFLHFFSKGAPAERFVSDEDTFDKLISLTESKDIKAHVSL